MTRLDRENSYQSSFSSPRSQKASVVSDVGRSSEASLQDNSNKELTPPSSVASEQDPGETSVVDNAGTSGANESGKTGKKRNADGQVKADYQPSHGSHVRHARNLSTLSSASTASLAELSESLKTKLSYALVKVQNGWQEHSIDEIESLAPLSPRSARYGDQVSTHQMQSPRSRIASLLNRENSGHGVGFPNLATLQDVATANQFVTGKKSLAPPAPIIPNGTRRGLNASHLQVNTSRRAQDQRPRAQQRTPSQNAAMEADAVETLLFMSASPSSSSHFNSQRSPLATMCPPWTPTAGFHASQDKIRPYTLKTETTTRAMHEYDSDRNADLDQALSIMAAHKAATMST